MAMDPLRLAILRAVHASPLAVSFTPMHREGADRVALYIEKNYRLKDIEMDDFSTSPAPVRGDYEQPHFRGGAGDSDICDAYLDGALRGGTSECAPKQGNAAQALKALEDLGIPPPPGVRLMDPLDYLHRDTTNLTSPTSVSGVVGYPLTLNADAMIPKGGAVWDKLVADHDAALARIAELERALQFVSVRVDEMGKLGKACPLCRSHAGTLHVMCPVPSVRKAINWSQET